VGYGSVILRVKKVLEVSVMILVDRIGKCKPDELLVRIGRSQRCHDRIVNVCVLLRAPFMFRVNLIQDSQYAERKWWPDLWNIPIHPESRHSCTSHTDADSIRPIP